MDIELHRDPAVFTGLAGEWNALLDRSISRVPFLRAEYQRVWWQYRGGGEWPEGTLIVAVARRADGTLAGIAPLFAAVNGEGRAALMPVGSREISDYLDFLVARQDVDEFCGALLERLTVPDVPAWEVLDMYNLPESSPTRAALARAAAGRGWCAAQQKLEPAPAIVLPDSWEAYLARLTRKDRHEIQRKLRRAEAAEGGIRWYFGGGESEAESEIETFLRLMRYHGEKKDFLTPAMRAQFAAIIRAAQAGGWLCWAWLEVDGEKAASYLAFDFSGRIWIYNSALDPRFGALSAGWVLLAHMLKWAIAQRRHSFDFMRGGEDYKFRFGGGQQSVYRLQISRSLTLAGLGGEPAVLQNPAEADSFP